LPPVQEFEPGHKILCHIPAAELMAMEPVIQLARKKAGPADIAAIAPGQAATAAKPAKPAKKATAKTK
jgi:hypothetical protein